MRAFFYGKSRFFSSKRGVFHGMNSILSSERTVFHTRNRFLSFSQRAVFLFHGRSGVIYLARRSFVSFKERGVCRTVGFVSSDRSVSGVSPKVMFLIFIGLNGSSLLIEVRSSPL